MIAVADGTIDEEDECWFCALGPSLRLAPQGGSTLVPALPRGLTRNGNRTTPPSEVIPHMDYKTAQIRESVPGSTVIGTPYRYSVRFPGPAYSYPCSAADRHRGS